MENLGRVCSDFDLGKLPFSLMTNDGAENQGEVSRFIAEHGNISRVENIEFSNSMVEAQHKKFKYGWLLPAGSLSFEEIVDRVALAVHEFRKRPHGALSGLSPLEVLSGQVPDPTRFQEGIARARSVRPFLNRNNTCSVC